MTEKQKEILIEMLKLKMENKKITKKFREKYRMNALYFNKFLNLVEEIYEIFVGGLNQTPKGSKIDPEGSKTDPQGGQNQTQSGSKIDPKRAEIVKKGSKIDPKGGLNQTPESNIININKNINKTDIYLVSENIINKYTLELFQAYIYIVKKFFGCDISSLFKNNLKFFEFLYETLEFLNQNLKDKARLRVEFFLKILKLYFKNNKDYMNYWEIKKKLPLYFKRVYNDMFKKEKNYVGEIVENLGDKFTL